MESTKFDFDFFVIGGGPGGNSAAKRAAALGAKVGLADFVKSSPKGTSWGLGGTCVNVGCIPKKMMHYAGLMYDQIEKYKLIGYPSEIKKEFNWENLVENVNIHISSLNFGYRSGLRSSGVQYFNKFAKFVDAHTLELTDKKGKTQKVTADKILMATGLRPAYPEIEGAKELCITSDDLFKLKKPPGKTLIIGASYIAVESASFLRSFGFDVSLMIRSILLRGFDRDMADKLGKCLENSGIKLLMKCTPEKFVKIDDKIICHYNDLIQNSFKQEEFDTILLAIGRKPDCFLINTAEVGINLSEKTGKIIVDEFEKTNVDNIFAIGDIAENHPELAPPAIKAGKLLAERLFGGSQVLADYENIATTVYARVEYGCCGMGEEEAVEKIGKENVKVYHSEFTPVEWTFDSENTETCYMKVIVNKKDKEKVVGFHILSPNAGEIIQGVALAMKCGVTKEILDQTVGVHPTVAEEMTTLTAVKGESDGKKTGC